jgi:hypothetical protein
MQEATGDRPASSCNGLQLYWKKACLLGSRELFQSLEQRLLWRYRHFLPIGDDIR